MTSRSDQFKIWRLTVSDNLRAGTVLADAFVNDPQYVYGLPDRQDRQRVYPGLFTDCVQYGLRFGAVWGAGATPDTLAGVVSCFPVPESEMTQERLTAAGFDLEDQFLGALLDRLFAVEAGAADLLAVAYPEPHLHLFQLGVSPSARGQGMGMALVQAVLNEADRVGRRVCLNTSSVDNVPFYQRCGLVEVGQGNDIPQVPWWAFGTVKATSTKP